MKLTKKVAIDSQLKTGIKLFFENKDLLSCHTLAAASLELLYDLADHNLDDIIRREAAKGRTWKTIFPPGRELERIYVKDEHQREWRRKLKEAANFLKHADRDAEAEIEVNIEALNAAILFHAVINYWYLFEDRPACFNLLLVWYCKTTPEVLKVPISEAFPSIPEEFHIEDEEASKAEIFRLAERAGFF